MREWARAEGGRRRGCHGAGIIVRRRTPCVPGCSRLSTMVLSKADPDERRNVARWRRWTEAEDTAIERATFDNAQRGILDSRPRPRPRNRARVAGDYAGRLRTLAAQLGRTYPAVLERAERIGAASYRPRGKEGES